MIPPKKKLDFRISIHAPREGGDFIDEVSLIWDNHFNPRPPRGGRPVIQSERGLFADYFNPRPPRGGRPHELPPP